MRLHLTLVFCLLPTVALADNRSFDVDHLQVATSSDDFLATEGAGRVLPWGYRAGLSYRFTDVPLVVDRGAAGSTNLIGTRSIVDLTGAIELGRHLGIGLDLPVLLDESGGGVGSGPAVGGLRLVPRVELLQGARGGVAALFGLRLPTGDTSRFLGEGGVVFEPRVAAQLSIGMLRLGANLGVRLRGARQYLDLSVGNEIFGSAAVAVIPHRRIDLFFELHADTAMSSQFASRQMTPVEALLGAGTHVGPVRIAAAGGFGLVDGFGSPHVRMLALVEYRRPEHLAPLAAPKMVAVLAPKPKPPAAPPPPPKRTPPPVVADDETPEPDVEVKLGRIELADPVFFDLNRRRIRSRFVDELEQLARVINRRPSLKVIWIEGHTDLTGPKAWNLELSRLRAEEVAAFLVKHGVEAARLRPVGFGEAHPIVMTLDPNERNRRTMFYSDAESRPAADEAEVASASSSGDVAARSADVAARSADVAAGPADVAAGPADVAARSADVAAPAAEEPPPEHAAPALPAPTLANGVKP